MDEHARELPLRIVERDGHVTIYCTATPEQNNGEPCVWSWLSGWKLANGSVQTNGAAIESAVRHAMERHM